ncbi:hypothetical protein IQ265_10880 [Nodosilinea sp. LEGE 06152]|nr:hypothetical protein [Nodosilinea sp. LEGE 06152]
MPWVDRGAVEKEGEAGVTGVSPNVEQTGTEAPIGQTLALGAGVNGYFAAA